MYIMHKKSLMREKIKFDLLIDPSTVSRRLRPSFDGTGRLTVNRQQGSWLKSSRQRYRNRMTAPSNRQVRLRCPALVAMAKPPKPFATRRRGEVYGVGRDYHGSGNPPGLPGRVKSGSGRVQDFGPLWNPYP